MKEVNPYKGKEVLSTVFKSYILSVRSEVKRDEQIPFTLNSNAIIGEVYLDWARAQPLSRAQRLLSLSLGFDHYLSFINGEQDPSAGIPHKPDYLITSSPKGMTKILSQIGFSPYGSSHNNELTNMIGKTKEVERLYPVFKQTLNPKVRQEIFDRSLTPETSFWQTPEYRLGQTVIPTQEYFLSKSILIARGIGYQIAGVACGLGIADLINQDYLNSTSWFWAALLLGAGSRLILKPK